MDIQIHQANYGETGLDINGEYEYYKIIGIREENNKVIIITRIDND